MRVALLLLLSAGCTGVTEGACDEDIECDDGLVCARGDHFCVLPSEVRATRSEWTINGQPPDSSSCNGFVLRIQFQSNQFEDDFGFSPVPCEPGVFTVDKLPIRYFGVELGIENSGIFDSARFDGEGNAFLDLQL